MSWRDNYFYFNPHENWIAPSSQDKDEEIGEYFRTFGLFTVYDIWGQFGIDFYIDKYKSPYEDNIRILRIIFASLFNPKNKDIQQYILIGWTKCMTKVLTPQELIDFFKSGYVPEYHIMETLLDTAIYLKAYEHQLIINGLIHEFYPHLAAAQRMSLDIE